MEKIQPFPSQANFILFKVLKGSASDVYDRLLDHKIIIKNVSNNNLLENCLRVTIGTQDENQAFVDALTKSL